MKISIKSIWEKAGFYIVLGLCVTTVGLTALLTGEKKNEPLPTLPPFSAASVPPGGTATPEKTPTAVEANVGMPESTPEAPSMPVRGEIAGKFSADKPVYNKTLGHYAVHQAIDIAAHESMPVHACLDGIVTAAYEDAMLGNVIVIDHGWFTAIYGSLSTLSLVREGDPVSKDQTISFPGTCREELHLGSHIHFAVIVDGEYVDPAQLFS